SGEGGERRTEASGVGLRAHAHQQVGDLVSCAAVEGEAMASTMEQFADASQVGHDALELTQTIRMHLQQDVTTRHGPATVQDTHPVVRDSAPKEIQCPRLKCAGLSTDHRCACRSGDQMQFQFGVILPSCQQIREVVLNPSQAAALVHDDEFAFDSGIVVAGRRLAPERTLIGPIRGFARSLACLALHRTILRSEAASARGDLHGTEGPWAVSLLLRTRRATVTAMSFLGAGRKVESAVFGRGVSGFRPKVPTSPQRLEAKAAKTMSAQARAYIMGGAGTESTVAANRAAFDRVEILPAMLRDTTGAD